MQLIILIILILLLIFIFKQFKQLNISCVFLIDGAVKGGKTLLSVHCAKFKIRLNKFVWYVRFPFLKLLHKEVPLKPMLYSNIPLRKIKYNDLTLDIIKRKVRIPNKSVVLMDEASLVADSMLYNDKTLNEEIQLFVKLFGHYSHGGTLILNTQSIGDLHFNFKRCISKYLYIYSRKKVPFFTILKVREMMYSDDGNNVTNCINSDLEDDLKTLIIPNSVYKMYDCYCYSIFTDNLPYFCNSKVKIKGKKDSLKQDKLVSFKTFKTLDRRYTYEKD